MSRAAPKAANPFAQPVVKMLVGAAATAAILVTLSKWLVTQPTFEPTDVAAMAVSALLMLGGVMTFLPTLDRRSLARALEPEAGERATLTDAEVGQLSLQGAIMVAAGAMLAAPPMLSDRPELGNLALVGLGAILALHTLLNILAWRASDAFNRRVMIESAALSFWGLQAALVLWAGAERMGLAPPITAWNGLVIVMAVSLLAGGWAAVRRTAA